jgi:putative RNase toxin 3 of polymorphic toxin system/uncharacterized protein DUF4157
MAMTPEGGLAQAPVQLKASGEAADREPVQQIAARGVSGASQPLPHAGTIQRLFGRHDIGEVQAHVGGPAADAADRLGATAYATGNSVAFRSEPDLHTAAHEVAHTVQQRGGVQLAGGVGQSGDAYERHADAVADAVVAGQSAEGLLDPFAGGGAPAVQKVVQKKDGAPGDPGEAVDREKARQAAKKIAESFHWYGSDEDVIRGVLNQSPETVRLIKKVYDAEFNKETGQGLIADLKKHGLEFCIAQLVRAGEHDAGTPIQYTRQDQKGAYPTNHRILANPSVAVAVPGTKITYEVDQGAMMYATGSWFSYQWTCVNDPETAKAVGGPATVTGPSSPRWEGATWNFAGNHKVVCRIQFHPAGGTPEPPEYLEYQQTVLAQKDVADSALAKAQQGADPEQQRKVITAYRDTLVNASQQPGSGTLDPKTQEGLDKYLGALGDRLKSTDKKERFPIKAVHVAAEQAQVSQLSVFVAKLEEQGGSQTWALVDVTNPADRRLTGEHHGTGATAEAAIQAAIDAWNSGNRYATGLIELEVPQAAAGKAITRQFQTTGMSFWDSISEFFSRVGMVAGIATLAAAVITTIAPDPTISKVAAALLWTSIVAGTAASVINIAQRHAEGFTDYTADGLDALNIAGNVLAGTWVRGAKVLLGSAGGSKIAQGILIGQFTTTAAQGVILGSQYTAQYDEIMKEPDPKKRTDQLVALISSASLSGALLLISLHGATADLKKIGIPGEFNAATLGNSGKTIDLSKLPAVEPTGGTHEPVETGHGTGGTHEPVDTGHGTGGKSTHESDLDAEIAGDKSMGKTSGATPRPKPTRADLADPFTHPEYPQWSAQATGIGMAKADADRMWTLIIEGLRDNKPANFEAVADFMVKWMKVPKGKAALWSGGIDLSDYAVSKGLTTLEAQKFYEATKGLKLYEDKSAVYECWKALSRKFVEQFDGVVHVYMREWDPQSVLVTTELEVLKSKGLQVKFHAMDWVDAPGHIGEFSVDHAFVELDAAGNPLPAGATMELTASQAQHAVDVAKARYLASQAAKKAGK